MPISHPPSNVRYPKLLLVNSRTCTLHKLLPGFQNGVDLVFDDIADRNPEPILLSRNQLRQRAFESGRIFRTGNFCIRVIGPTEIFGKNREEDSNRVEQR